MNRKVTAHIHSLDGKFAEVTILKYNREFSRYELPAWERGARPCMEIMLAQ